MQSPSSCSFTDLFAVRLASKLIPFEEFKRILTSSHRQNDVGNGGSKRDSSGTSNVSPPRQIYWRTPLIATPAKIPCSSRSKSNEDDAGKTFFVDVNLTFIEEEEDFSEKGSQGVKVIPRVDVHFGALVQFHQEKDNNEAKPTQNGEESLSTFYIQSNVITKNVLENYAEEISVDFDETGYTGMADLMSSSLLSSSSNAVKVYLSSNRNETKGICRDVAIGFFHEDLLGEGKLSICQNQCTSDLMDGHIGKTSLQMMLSNFENNHNENNVTKQDKVEIDKQRKEEEEELAMELFHQWWEEVNERRRHAVKSKKSSSTTYKETGISNEAVCEKNKAKSKTSHNEKTDNAPTEGAASIQIRKRRMVHEHARIQTKPRSRSKKKKGQLRIGKMT